ncbi:MAG: transporter related protein [Frankiales bacterium]|nr:transporter related protein [Frankiales bacterium]
MNVEKGVVLQAEGITKRYGGVAALDGVSFDLRRGEVHALLGENGAGKSTLIKVLSGSVPRDEGTVVIDGTAYGELTPPSAVRAGVSTVFQELALVRQLSVAENLFLGRELRRRGLRDKRRMTTEARGALERIGVDLDPRTSLATFSRAQLQLVEIARALHRGSPILILDEPTASLSAGEAARLFAIVGRLKAEGVGIVYISHRLGEVRQLADRITVLRDGRGVGTVDAAGVTNEHLVRLMTGRTLDELFPQVPKVPGRIRLALSGVSTATLQEVALEVRAGEVVALAGLVGSGKSEIGRACFGLERLTAGTVEIDGTASPTLTPRRALERGLIYYPADRHREGLVTTGTLGDNVLLPSLVAGTVNRFGFVSRPRSAGRVQEVVEQLSIKPAQAKRKVLGFSGGNQQKALLARAFAREYAVHIFDEPTVGIDIGAKHDVYQHIKRLCAAGAAVLLISSDMEEVLGLAHRVYAVREGRVVADLRDSDVTEHNIIRAFFEPTPPLVPARSACS